MAISSIQNDPVPSGLSASKDPPEKTIMLDGPSSFQTQLGDHLLGMDFIVANMNCAGCMSKIERHFSQLPTIKKVRVNLSQKLVHFEWLDGQTSPHRIQDELNNLGFQASPFLNDDEVLKTEQAEMRRLLWSLAVAGFAAANVMLLSVSVWSGATGATRDLFHWLSALIALPAVAFAGQPFFGSAYQALKSRHLNMDVPISLAVILASAISLFETMRHGEHAFFDAALTLLFFLLIGRTLDRLMRERAFSGVRQLLAFKNSTAQIINNEGQKITIPISEIAIGMVVVVLPGETIPIDGRVIEGVSDVDWALVNGESIPRLAEPETDVFSGLVNLSGPLKIETKAIGDKTLLAEIIRLMGQANERAPYYRRLADRAAAFYAPVVHLLAIATFLGWLAYDSSWQTALYTAISVLIITCPCALGLAVPVVQVVASSIAHRRGILMKDGSALEKLSEVDTVVFDKTGTLTLSSLTLSGKYFEAENLLPLASKLAHNSLHPLSKALAGLDVEVHSESDITGPIVDIKEHPGRGLQGKYQDGELRLGSFDWCNIDPSMAQSDGGDLMLWTSFKKPDAPLSFALYTFEDQLRPGAIELINELNRKNIYVHLLSGDRSEAVGRMAQCLNIQTYKAEMKPAEKCNYIENLGKAGHKVLMVGDGINDGPSLKAAYVSLSPSSASDVAQVTASFILMKESLQPIIGLINLAKNSKALIYQNFGLAFIYNLIAVPIAIVGLATPIVAAVAMSLSSMIVTANALRLHLLSSAPKWQETSSTRSTDE